MGMIKLICEQCAGGIELDDSREFGFCTYCGAKALITPDITHVTQNVTKHVYGHEGKDAQELVADGFALIKIGDEKKANAKFKTAIDIEPTNWQAWLGYASTGGTRTDYLSCVPAYQKAYNAANTDEEETVTFNSMVEYLPDRHLRAALVRAYGRLRVEPAMTNHEPLMTKHEPAMTNHELAMTNRESVMTNHETAMTKRRHEIFDMVLGVIGCDESEIATLVIDLCPNDWRALLAKAKIRQIRVRWVEVERTLFGAKFPLHATEVLNIFMAAYRLAKAEGEEAKRAVQAHIGAMEADGSYKVFVNELYVHMRREGL